MSCALNDLKALTQVSSIAPHGEDTKGQESLTNAHLSWQNVRSPWLQKPKTRGETQRPGGYFIAVAQTLHQAKQTKKKKKKHMKVLEPNRSESCIFIPLPGIFTLGLHESQTALPTINPPVPCFAVHFAAASKQPRLGDVTRERVSGCCISQQPGCVLTPFAGLIS